MKCLYKVSITTVVFRSCLSFRFCHFRNISWSPVFLLINLFFQFKNLVNVHLSTYLLCLALVVHYLENVVMTEVVLDIRNVAGVDVNSDVEIQVFQGSINLCTRLMPISVLMLYS